MIKQGDSSRVAAGVWAREDGGLDHGGGGRETWREVDGSAVCLGARVTEHLETLVPSHPEPTIPTQLSAQTLPQCSTPASILAPKYTWLLGSPACLTTEHKGARPSFTTQL